MLLKVIAAETWFILFSIFFDSIHGQQMQLVAGHVLFRHGDRTPLNTYPTDPMKETDWPNGFGQLTIAGIEQHHRLGAYLRSRYGSILNSTYIASEIGVRSTDYDRTLMSAQSDLIGLYPLFNISDHTVPIQPIPIHTVPQSEDFLLGLNLCPRYDQLEAAVYQSDDFKNMNTYYESFFEQLKVWTNLTNITAYNAWDIADTIFIENIYGKAPAWANEAVQKNLSVISDLSFHFLYASNESQRIRGGPLIQAIWSNINDSVHGLPYEKLQMYSAHDTTVSGCLSFLGINYPHQPPYASALFVDLYQQDSNYFVRVEYLNVTDSNISYPHLLDGCPSVDCPLSTFTSIYQPRFPTSADIECTEISPPTPPSGGGISNGNLAAILTVLVIVILGIALFGIFGYRYIKRKSYDPTLLPTEGFGHFA